MQTFSELKKNLKKDFTGLVPVKVALLGDSAIQLLAQALRTLGHPEQAENSIHFSYEMVALLPKVRAKWWA